MFTEATNPIEVETEQDSSSTMPKSMITDWPEGNADKFQKEIMGFGHDLAGTGLFTDAALINLLERHPSELLDVCTMGQADHPQFPNKFRTGDFREASGETLLKVAKAGRVWINCREAMNVHKDYKDVLDMMYGELAERTGNATFNPRGGILISSPVARVPYHFDKTETLLWHVRGKKRMYIYPQTEKFISDEAYENTLTNAIEDDIPFDESFEDFANAIDIPENTALCWELNAPHRVDNQTFCVSVTTEYSTQKSGMKNAAMLTNAALRRYFGMNPSYRNDGEMKRKVKSIFGRALSKTKLAPDNTDLDMVSFKVVDHAKGFIVDVDPFVRNF